MNAVCWPTDVCFRVINARKDLEDRDKDISSLEKENLQLSDNLSTAIRHISCLISCPEMKLSTVRQAALDFLFKMQTTPFIDPFSCEGFDAFYGGVDKEDCPYDEGTDGQYGWLKGWREANRRDK